jgi:hypothetical protein
MDQVLHFKEKPLYKKLCRHKKESEIKKTFLEDVQLSFLFNHSDVECYSSYSMVYDRCFFRDIHGKNFTK